MKNYVLNETPLKTTNNFGINDLKIDLEIPVINDFNKYKFDKKIKVKQEVLSNYNSRIGLNNDKYLNVNIDIEGKQDNIIVNYDFNNSEGLVSVININYLKNSEANIIFKYKSDRDILNNTKFIINSDINSKGNISIVNMLSNESISAMAIENYESDNSDITINFIDLGGNVRISNYYAELNKLTKNIFNNIYIGNSEDRIDMNYIVKLLGEKCYGEIKCEGALDDKAFKSFKGTLDFVKGAVGAVGKENENCILLNDSIKCKSLPMMLCHEEDVSGSHGVSSGKIDKNKLFYLMSRGLDEKEAKRLIINANFLQVIRNIPDSDICEEILELISQKVG